MLHTFFRESPFECNISQRKSFRKKNLSEKPLRAFLAHLCCEFLWGAGGLHRAPSSGLPTGDAGVDLHLAQMRRPGGRRGRRACPISRMVPELGPGILGRRGRAGGGAEDISAGHLLVDDELGSHSSALCRQGVGQVPDRRLCEGAPVEAPHAGRALRQSWSAHVVPGGRPVLRRVVGGLLHEIPPQIGGRGLAGSQPPLPERHEARLRRRRRVGSLLERGSLGLCTMAPSRPPLGSGRRKTQRTSTSQSSADWIAPSSRSTCRRSPGTRARRR